MNIDKRLEHKSKLFVKVTQEQLSDFLDFLEKFGWTNSKPDGHVEYTTDYIFLLSYSTFFISTEIAKTEKFLITSTFTEAKIIDWDADTINSPPICVGDTVSVHFHGAQSTLSHEAEVLGVAGKDHTWIFRDIRSNDIHHVSEPCTVSKKR